MALDHNIPFMAMSTVKVLSPQEHRQNALAMQMNKMQLQDQQDLRNERLQQRGQQNALSLALQGSRGADGTIDYSKASAFPGISPADAMKFDDSARANAEQQKLKQQKQNETVRAALVYADSPEKWDQTVDSMAQQYPDVVQFRGKYTPELRQSLIAQYAPDLLKPQFKQVDIGGRVEFIDINPLTNPSIKTESFKKTLTPGQSATNIRIIQGNQPQIVTIPTQADGQQTAPLRLGSPPKGVKLPVGTGWDVDRKMVVPLPGIGGDSGGTSMPAGFKLPAGYVWDSAAGGVRPVAGSPADKKAVAAKAAVADAVAKGNQAISVIDQALNHPGRKTATGLSGVLDPRNYIPGTDSTDFQVVMDQINGQSFLQAFESLKGGGQITEIEGKKATAAIARLNRNQSDKAFVDSLKELKTIIRTGLARANNSANTNQPAPPVRQQQAAPTQPAPKSSNSSSVDDLLKKYGK